MSVGGLWGGWDMSGSWLQHLGGCWVQGWCLWAGSLVPAWQLSGLLGPTLLGHTATLEAESQRSFSGPRTGRDSVSCVHWGSAHLSLCPRQLVCPSFWSLCVCILSSALPSLLAPPLVSSSLTYWQDEVPRLPPGAHSPRSAPRAAGGGWLAAAWPCGPQSKWTDTSSPVWPWVWLWVADSSTHRETPPCTCMGPRAVSRVSGLSRLVNLALQHPTEVSQEIPVHTRTGAQGRLGLCPCPCLSCVCPFLCCVLCIWSFSWSTLPPPSPPWVGVCCVGLGALCIA